MSISCDPASLVAAARCFECIPESMQKPVELYLLAVAAGGSLDPATIVKAAKCFSCIPKSERQSVENYLLCQWANKQGGGGAIVNNIALVGTNFGGTDSTGLQLASLTYDLGGASVTAGNTVIVGVALAKPGAMNNFAPGQLTKSAGTATIGTIALDSSKNQGAGDIQCAVYRVPITGSGTLTLQYANGVVAFILMGAAEFSGLNAAPVGTSDSTSGNAQPESSNAIATSALGMIFYIATEDSTLNWARTWSDTLVYNQQNGTTRFTGLVQFKLVNTSPNTLTSTVEAAGINWITASQAYITS